MSDHSRTDISAWRWFSFFGVYAAALSLLLLWANGSSREQLANLCFFTLYVSFACTFCPLPILWIFLWISRDFNPLIVALLGSTATAIANLHDYYILNSMLRWDRLARARDSRWYKKASIWFTRYPFSTLTVANFLPLPIDVVRLLAISTGYSRAPFTAATLVGRFPRYLILAWLGYELDLSNTAIAVVLLITILVAAVKALPKLRERWKNWNK